MENPVEKKIRCPYCGYEMPIFVRSPAECWGVFVRCKGRGCKRIFEIKVKI